MTTEITDFSPESITKLEQAASIAESTLSYLLPQTVGKSITQISKLGDEFMLSELNKLSHKNKGIAFPTSVNVNNVICHATNSDQIITKDDIVKIECGVHIDGYPAMIASTNKEADAAYYALEAAIKKIKVGGCNYDVTDVVSKVAKEYGYTPVEGILSSQLVPGTLDGDKQIILNPNESQRKEFPKQNFEAGEMYSIDILLSKGNGKSRLSQAKTTIYKKVPGVNYELKLMSSRKFYSEATRKHGYMPFNITNMDKSAKMGVVECVKNRLFMPYDILEEHETVVQMLATVLIMPNGEVRRLTKPVYTAGDCKESVKKIMEE